MNFSKIGFSLLLVTSQAVAQSPPPIRLPPPTQAIRLVNHEDVPPGIPAPANNGPSLVDLEQMALDHNPALAAAAARVEAARGKWYQAGLRPNPVAGYSGEEIGDDGTAGKQGAFIGQQFITSGKLRLDRAVVAQEIDRAEQNWSAWRQRVLTDVRIGFYAALIAQRRLEMTQELLRSSESAVKVARQLVEAKETSRVDVLQATIEANTIRIQFNKAQNAHVAAWRGLSAVLGRPDLAPQPIAGDIEAVRRDIAWQGALSRLLSESPEIAAAHAQRHRAQWAVDRAWAERIPNINAQVSVHKDNTTGDTVAGIQLGIPLPILNRNQGGITKAKAELATAEHYVDQVELSLRQRLAIVYQRYADARFEVKQYTKDIRPAAKESMELVAIAYTAGETNYLAMLTAQRTYFRTNLAYVESLRQLWAASLEIDGLLLTGGL
jgi:cobalt-zinc-cadmium efflux system outer membrane protein